MSDWRDDVLHDLSAQERAEVDAEGEALAAQARTIAEARKALSKTQSEVAATMKITQGALSQMEKREDMMVSTMRSYIEAMGGRLRLVAEFPGMSPFDVSVGESDAAVEAKTRR